MTSATEKRTLKFLKNQILDKPTLDNNCFNCIDYHNTCEVSPGSYINTQPENNDINKCTENSSFYAYGYYISNLIRKRKDLFTIESDSVLGIVFKLTYLGIKIVLKDTCNY